MTHTHYVCGTCSHVYLTDKPQDPEREDGYGTCPYCTEAQVREMVAKGSDFLTARTRLQKYA